MKVPKKIRVGPDVYKVIVNGQSLNNEAVAMGAPRGLYGITDPEKCTITLHTENGCVRQRTILLHEVLHTINEVTGIISTLGREKEEDVVMRTAPILLDVLRCNPRLVDYLLAPE